jgi:hypothetical protein
MHWKSIFTLIGICTFNLHIWVMSDIYLEWWLLNSTTCRRKMISFRASNPVWLPLILLIQVYIGCMHFIYWILMQLQKCLAGIRYANNLIHVSDYSSHRKHFRDNQESNTRLQIWEIKRTHHRMHIPLSTIWSEVVLWPFGELWEFLVVSGRQKWSMRCVLWKEVDFAFLGYNDSWNF